MFKSLFQKKQKTTTEHVLAPINGQIADMEQVPDPTFAQKMLGDGLAVIPSDGTVSSPIDGEIVQLFPTKHAVGIRGKSGMELLIHIGLETVSMNGEGFTAHVRQGQKVKAGDPLINVDLEQVKNKAAHTITPVVITNMDAVASIEKRTVTDAVRGETVMMEVKMKA
ncbi:PTS system glucose-specific IIA component [Scopulibacillus daqui]|uniref:PTS system glucose-specific IIA component n=1 Tax=Scopulibacillus daqui TaxID=1469162 RepID=A0ABS2PYM0_9BACL|nr:PTS glucose transporter subunit IIA [Scopulibacillus daqui]MBM7644961.1 PTS system glucose-specific IIA component [Scopulibacillus daqui]